MLSITDPCELKPVDVYRQARQVSAKTSRGSDRNWYRDAFELGQQWHLWFDGGREVVSATFSRPENCWRPGPAISLASLTTGDDIGDLLADVLSSKYFGTTPKALGVIIHVADEFALAGLAQSTEAAGDSAGDLNLLRYNLIDDPREVLADREISTETTSWRLLPLWGAPAGQPRATAIALSRSREAFLGKLLAHSEELRVPVRVAVTCAAVESLAALPLLRPNLPGGMLIVLPYQKFSAVFAITADGELRTVRSLMHRGTSLVPTGLGDILLSMAISTELVGQGASSAPPQIMIVSGNPQSLQLAGKELEAYSLSRQKIQFELLDLSAHPSLAHLPGSRPELLVYETATIEQARTGSSPLARTETFASLWGQWLKQSSFYDVARLDALYPSLQDLRLLKFSVVFVALQAFALIGSVGYGAFAFYKASNHPSWRMTPDQVLQTEAAQVKLQTEQRQIAVTDRLLKPRSRGWATLDFLLQLFPEESAVRLDAFNYTIDPARAVNAAAKDPTGVETTGMLRTWSFRGLAKPQSQDLLNSLNSQRGLAAFFDRLAAAIGDPSYKPDPSRLLTVTLTQGRNPRYATELKSADAVLDPAMDYPFTFEATITQALNEKDALALPAEKPF